jgi:Flp pilus assembly pilin Flp
MDLETYLVVAAMAVAIAVVAQTGLSGLLSSSFSSVASKIMDHSANPKL